MKLKCDDCGTKIYNSYGENGLTIICHNCGLLMEYKLKMKG